MNLHDDKSLFADAVMACSQHTGINPVYVEKDYWITRSLKLLSEVDKNNRAIFKGGTSLSKVHLIGKRFSEDIDIAISEASSLNGNQRKMLIKRLAKAMTLGLVEIPTEGITSKGSSYYRAIYGYESLREISPGFSELSIRKGQLMVEINSFANPNPFTRKPVDNFIGAFLHEIGRDDVVSEYGLGIFYLNVLDKRRTATEKIVSLIRHSLSNNCINELSKKIRHFYDLYFLMEDDECRQYFNSSQFLFDLFSLLNHDRQLFDNPDGWNNRPIAESPMFNSLEIMWEKTLGEIYSKELSSLAYETIPESEDVLKNILELIDIVKSGEGAAGQ